MQNLDQSSVVSYLSSVFHKRLKSHELGLSYEIVVKFKSPTFKLMHNNYMEGSGIATIK